MTSTSSPPTENVCSASEQSVQNSDFGTPSPEIEDSDGSSPPAKRYSTCSPPAVEVYSSVNQLPYAASQQLRLRQVRRYSTSCPPPAKHQKFYLPTYSSYSREEAKESILAGSLFRPITIHDYGNSDDDAYDNGSATRSSSYVSVDSAYSSQSDAARKNSPLVAAPSNRTEDGNSAQSSRLRQSVLPRKIQAKLHCKMLWRTFLNIGNEMIVTKPGR